MSYLQTLQTYRQHCGNTWSCWKDSGHIKNCVNIPDLATVQFHIFSMYMFDFIPHGYGVVLQHQSRSSSKHGSTVLFQKMKAVLPHRLHLEGNNLGDLKQTQRRITATHNKDSILLQEIICIHQKFKHTLNPSFVYC